MKIFPLKILNEIEKNTILTNPILFYGNEGGLILGLIKSIYSILKEKIDIDDIKYFNYKKK